MAQRRSSAAASRRTANALFIVVATAMAACGPPAASRPAFPHLDAAQVHDPGELSPATLSEWARVPRGDTKQEIALGVRDDTSGRGFEGRGVVVVRPGHALRMILLGPGGTTAMDVWIRDGAWRVAIPALDRVVRGDASTPRASMRGLPIALLWRWLVTPFGGTLRAAHEGAVQGDGSIVAQPLAGAHGARSFVEWSARDDALEARARIATPTKLLSRGWWFQRGDLVAWLEGAEDIVEGTSGASAPIIATEVTYVALDPPMTVHVHTASSSLVEPDEPLPDATFADPDGAEN